MKNFKIEMDGDGIALITWDMPGRSMNVISASVLSELVQLVERIRSDDAVTGAVITGGKDAFCAGADLEELGSLLGAGLTADAGETDLKQAFERAFALNAILRELETCGKPIAAAINGTALGGGFEVALACHYRVAGDSPETRIGLPESRVGIMPGGGGTQRLPRIIGARDALPLMLEGRSLDPKRALQQKLIHKVVPAGELIGEAKRWIKDGGIARQPWDEGGFRIPGGGPHDEEGAQTFIVGNAMLHARTYGNYPAQQHIMSAVYEGLLVPMDTAIRIETRYFVKTLIRPEAQNMIRTLFRSTQELKKGIRRPSDAPTTDVKKIGILGAGMMGAGIAYVSAMVDIDVVLIDMDRESAEKGKDYSVKLLDKRVKRDRMTAKRKDEILARITPTTDYALLEGADLVIEAVFEDRDVKADVTAKAEAVVPEAAVFGSNTSTLPITGLAMRSKRPKQFIGIHFFSPVDKMPLVEIIVGEETGDQAIAVALDYVKKIKKTPIVVNDSRGFYTSRVFSTFVRESIIMLSEGVKPALIENSGKMSGMPVAPLAMNDEVSIELGYHIMRQTKKDLGDKYQGTPADDIMEKMVVDLERKGRKNGKGFYEYPKDGKKYLWPGLSKLAEESAEQPSVDELKKRFLYIQALETARCFEEKVLTDVREADVGSILGWGYAPYSGGTLSFIDTVGTRAFVEECDRLAQKYGPRFAPNKLLRDMADKNETFYTRFNPETATAAA